MGQPRNVPGRLVNRPERAQFFTPPVVAEFMWQVVRFLGCPAREADWRVIDPAAGRGAFLEVALAARRLLPEQVYGIELDPDLAGGLGARARQARFHVGDGLLGEFAGVELGSFDVVLGNPPFGRLGAVLPSSLLTEWEQRGNWHEGFAVWRALTARARGRLPAVRSIGVELLFVERCLDLAREGGLVALVLPEGFVANDRLQSVRDWVLHRAAVLGVVGLPEAAFRRAGLNARTVVVFLRKGPESALQRGRVFVADSGGSPLSLDAYLAQTLAEWRRLGRGSRGGRRDGHSVPADGLVGRRWDAGFWKGQTRDLRVDPRFPLVPFGDFIALLTYGPIVTSQRPVAVPGGIRVIRQGDFTETGLCLDSVLRVDRAGVYDPPRSRVRQGDLLMPRSGCGSLGRNRVAVYLDEEPANVSCFVDVIRLTRLNPFFAWFYLRSLVGWRQIRSLINGVGTPNINFAEIRSLLVPVVPWEVQQTLEHRYREEVLHLHGRRNQSAALHQEAEERFRRIVADLERYLAGDGRALRPAARVVGP